MQKRSVALSNAVLALSALWVAAPPLARIADAQGDQFGIQSRADAASQMIVLGVQQGISSLPPTSGQAFTYDYNAELGSFVESEELGPTVLRSTTTIGANKLSLRAAVSYFDLSETFDAIPYQVTGPMVPGVAYTKFGMVASARVVLLNFAATYGFTDRIEGMVNFPVTVVDAQASQIYTTFPPPFPPPQDARIAAVTGSVANLNAALASGDVVLRTSSFSSLGANFNDGSHGGLGRISVGAKGLFLANDWGELAASGEFFCNSPSQNEFAGSNSPSILPRLIGQIHAMQHLNMHADVGYEWDFDVNELSRFVWNTGFSVPIPGATFDVGVGGSKFNESIKWTPVATNGTNPPVHLVAVDPSATELGTNYVDFLFGVKVKLIKGTVLGGGVNVPVTSDGFRAAAIGTISLEYYF